MALSRLAGVAFLWIDGRSYPLVGDALYNPSSVTRESLVGMDTVHGFKETPMAGYIEGTIRDGNDLSVASLNGLTDSTVVLELANGKTVTGRNMWTAESQEVDLAEGKFKVRFEGPDVKES